MIVEGVSKCDFAMSRDVACRVSMFATTYKTFNINSDCRDAKFCVSTATMLWDGVAFLQCGYAA